MRCTGRSREATWGDAIAVSALTYTDSDVTAGTSYFYIVHAVGSTDWSNTPKVTIGGGTAKPTTKPTLNATAEGLTAIDADLEHDFRRRRTTIMRRWNSETNAWDRIGGNLNGNSHTDDRPGVRGAILVYFARRQRRRQWPLVLIRRNGLRDGDIARPLTEKPVVVLTITPRVRRLSSLRGRRWRDGAEYDLQRMHKCLNRDPSQRRG